jgi:hypothetical protein
MIKHRVRTIVLSAVVTAGYLTLGTSVMAQTALTDVLEEGISANVIAQESQARVDTLVDETDKVITQYKTVLKTVDGLKVYNTQMERSIERQKEAMAELNTSIKEVTLVKRQIAPLLDKMVSGIEEFIKNDIPFQLESRLAGLDRVKDLMTDPNVDASEKFRTVFELYQIESDYGKVFQSYPETMIVNGDQRIVDMLMIGRVGLLYQTSDGLVSGAFNKVTREFEIVDEATYAKSIGIAIGMANQRVALDTLVTLPISAPEKM